MKKLSKNFNVVISTVEAMAMTCNNLCTCSCNTGTYCGCNTISDYAGYQYTPNTSTMKNSTYNTTAQFNGIV